MRYLTGHDEENAKQWMSKAAEVATRARCHKAKCGTVVVRDGIIIGEGYNTPPLDMEDHRTCDTEFGPGKPLYDQTCCMHAEWRAIMDALKRNGSKIEGSSLYFTRVNGQGEIKKSGEPYCTVCSRMALDAGIAYFLLWQDNGIAEYPTGEYNRLSYEYVYTG